MWQGAIGSCSGSCICRYDKMEVRRIVNSPQEAHPSNDKVTATGSKAKASRPVWQMQQLLHRLRRGSLQSITVRARSDHAGCGSSLTQRFATRSHHDVPHTHQASNSLPL